MTRSEIAQPEHPIPDPASGQVARRFPWHLFFALLAALLGQFYFEPPHSSLLNAIVTGGLLFLLALLLLVWAIIDGEISISNPDVKSRYSDFLQAHWRWATLSLIILWVAFMLFINNKFTLLNVSIWFGGLALLLFSFWNQDEGAKPRREENSQGVLSKLNDRLKLSPWAILFILIFCIIFLFRFYRIDSVPPEGISDHAEKLWDVADVLNGQTRIFFPRNTGREAFQMYLTAAVALVFGTGVSFLSLKLGTALAGLATMPFVYLLGKEIGGRRVGMLAMLMAGMSYWGNVISRVALRYTLYPFFASIVLYFLVRGLQRGHRNSMILAGLFLGLGLHGYTAFRIMPFVVWVVIGIYLLKPQGREQRMQVIYHGVLAMLFALAVFLPLLRYSLENPDMVLYRSATRLTGMEHAIDAPVLKILLGNFWRGLAMLNWWNGDIWAHSVPGRPALDVVGGALFIFGVVLVLARLIRERSWLDAALLFLVPLLMLPSMLSIAFPGENPSLNRTGAALIPVFILAALALEGIIGAFERGIHARIGRTLAWSLTLVLLIFSGYQNYDLVFNQYATQYRLNSWNSSEMGTVVKDFIATGGKMENAFVLSTPYWVDSRMVAINAGYPLVDPVIDASYLPQTQGFAGSKLFLLKYEDSLNLETLKNLYPQGIVNRYLSHTPGKDFWAFYVPADEP